MRRHRSGHRSLLPAVLFSALFFASHAVHCAEAPADPWEGFNRKVYALNEFLDRNLVKPVAKVYQKVTPQIVDDGISNFFSNLEEVPDLLNHLLQLRMAEAFVGGGRLIVNTTIGLGGFIDVATRLGLERTDTDFGLTLGRWGADSGPYLVLPFFGASTVRDGFGRVGDFFFLHPLNYVEDDVTRYSLRALEVTDLRADLLKAEELITGDRYVFLRDLYLQRRQYLLTGELPEDDFGDEEF